MIKNQLERAIAAMKSELLRQSKVSGCATEIDGDCVQIDGPFQLEPLASAIISAIQDDAETEQG